MELPYQPCPALVCIAHDPGVRLRDIADALGITERTAFGIVTDLTEAGYVVKDKDGRRNRYRIQDHLPCQKPSVESERSVKCLDCSSTLERQQPRNSQTETSLPTDHLQPVANAPRGVTESLRRRAPCAPHQPLKDAVGALVPACRSEHFVDFDSSIGFLEIRL